MTREEEEVLWQNGQLGSGTPHALINTMWWLMSQYFGLRGRQEHHQMKEEDFNLQHDDDGTEFLTFEEGLTKAMRKDAQSCALSYIWRSVPKKKKENERSVLLFSNQQTRFKHLVQENTSGQKYYKHYHEKNERKLTSEGTLSTKEDH